MFQWTPTLDASCPPLRGQGPAVVPKPLDDKKLLAAAKSFTANVLPNPSLASFLETGNGTPADEAEAFLLAVTAKGDKLVDAIVDRWFARHGARTAVEIVSLVGATRPSPVTLMGPSRALMLARVRHHLAHASDYAAALDFVASHDGIPHGTPHWIVNHQSYNVGREIFAYLFPDHRPFFNAAASQLIAARFTTTYLLGAVATDDDVGRLDAAGIGYQDWDRNALHVAHVTEDAGLPRLAAYTAKSNQVVGVARALTAYVSAEAAATLAEYIGQKSVEKAVLPILREYFTAHPALSDAALTPLLRSRKKQIRGVATALLDAVKTP